MKKLSKEEFKKLIAPFKITKSEIDDSKIKEFVKILPDAIKYQQLSEMNIAVEAFQKWTADLATCK